MAVLDLFNKLTEYAGKWSVSSEEPMPAALAKSVVNIVVSKAEKKPDATFEPSKAFCFTLKSGVQKFIPISNTDVDNFEIGEEIDPKSVVMLVLSKDGEEDILRVTTK